MAELLYEIQTEKTIERVFREGGVQYRYVATESCELLVADEEFVGFPTGI
jgi:hypothetical protein